MSSCDAIFFDLIWPDMTWGVMMWKTWFENGHRIQRVRLPMINRFYDVLGCFLPSWTNMMCILLITTWYPRKYINFPGSMRKSCNTSKSYKIHFCQLKCTAACQNAYSDQVFASLSMLYLQICTAVAFCICICTTSTKVPGCIWRRAPSDSHVAFFLWNFAPQALVHVLLVFSTPEWGRWGVESVQYRA